MPGEYALLYACILLQKQPNTKILAIGADSYNDRLQQGLYSLGFLTQAKRDNPYRAFEKGSDGIIMGEGAAALLLETESSARARGAEILAEISGVFQNSSADQPYNYAATPIAAIKVIEQLTQASGKSLGDYDLLNLSANGVPPLDKLESGMLEQLSVSDIPCRTLNDYIGIFPGAGLLRLLLAIASFKHRRQMKSLQNGNTLPIVEPMLHKPLEKFDQFVHLTNGLGGNAMAIDVRVVH
jgi:3-oxoacyl-(acyl-carrier-protein) synthase